MITISQSTSPRPLRRAAFGGTGTMPPSRDPLKGDRLVVSDSHYSGNPGCKHPPSNVSSGPPKKGPSNVSNGPPDEGPSNVSSAPPKKGPSNVSSGPPWEVKVTFSWLRRDVANPEPSDWLHEEMTGSPATIIDRWLNIKNASSQMKVTYDER